MRSCLALVVVGFLAASVDPIKVFVTTAPTVEGFTQPDEKHRQDSVKDIQKDLEQHHKNLVVVASPEQADIVITVIEREMTRGPIQGASGLLVVSLTAGTFTTEFREFTRVRTFSGLAGVIDDKVEKWVKENRKQLLDRRTAK